MIHPSALKRTRQNAKNRLRNMALRSRARTIVKKVRSFVANNDYQGAMVAFVHMQSVLDKMTKTGLYHRNKTARIKSRVNAHIKKIYKAG